MSSDEKPELIRIAEAISDGTPVDWEARSSAPPADELVLTQLRDLERGQTLEEALARQGPFGAHEAAMIGMELCRALAAVHRAGLVHRDLKAANVMREQGGRVVLTDLGAAREHASGAGDEAAPQGTPATMAPEQLLGGAVGPAADIYGLGALLFRLVTGRYPIEASSLTELCDRHR